MSIKKSLLIIIIILLIDQISKLYIKMNFQLGEDLEIFSWFRISFIENDGMAWGTKLSDIFSFITDKSAKLILTIFRILAVTGIGYWLYDVIKKQKTKTLIFAISLIFAGALGNIIDSVFYGVFFSDSYGQVATFLPEEGGYSGLFYGKVVDMLNFPLYNGILPDWLPFFGGKQFSFFDPVFNVADVAISTGIGILIVFNKRAFREVNSFIKIDNSSYESNNNPT
ncbi:lipoprotein signal peptidase [Winogradskyella haliclonae]|uniref:Lipoprotein signal peptidase n=1 Tax=Winogradskyella haliclonae TaxID=2048558 RepID=A0ABQ2BVJ0_9FLAO|nr:lipoprotein signal peptidase [Winogradskyella haliclonae]GGI56511.1 lipoprotein signal peptidase [Winogradskyella haliclonae]